MDPTSTMLSKRFAALLVLAALVGVVASLAAWALNPAPTQPIELPGVILAALASIGLGISASRPVRTRPTAKSPCSGDAAPLKGPYGGQQGPCPR